jgi:oxygen-independent coproporphyrinogen-3 oxidase
MPAGIYLHIPFCRSRCSYCDFATDVYRSGDAVERYVSSLVKEIASFGSDNPPPEGGTPNAVDTIYFGGGTPSLLKPDQIERILNVAREKFAFSPEPEITMEMNPATVTAETLAAFRSLGVNRASFGVQTFDDRALRLLARGHDAADARNTFKLLRNAGFQNISFDLIAGLPNQTLQDWKNNLDEALAMRPEHLSLYLLEIHEATPLAEQIRSGRQPQPDEDFAAEMYELMIDKLSAAGYEQYEISNFARPGFESRHNSKYWRLDPVFGFGVSAHSFDGRERYANERDTAKYVERIERAGTAQITRETIDAASESAFLGLRMTSGINFGDLEKRFGVDLSEKYAAELSDLTDAGLVQAVGKDLRLTQKGMLYSNEVFRVFV